MTVELIRERLAYDAVVEAWVGAEAGVGAKADTEGNED